MAKWKLQKALGVLHRRLLGWNWVYQVSGCGLQGFSVKSGLLGDMHGSPLPASPSLEKSCGNSSPQTRPGLSLFWALVQVILRLLDCLLPSLPVEILHLKEHLLHEANMISPARKDIPFFWIVVRLPLHSLYIVINSVCLFFSTRGRLPDVLVQCVFYGKWHVLSKVLLRKRKVNEGVRVYHVQRRMLRAFWVRN